MDETGKNIVFMMEQVKKLYGQVALLLESAETLMEERGWQSRGSQSLSISTALYNSKQWAPRVAFRFYQSEGAKHLLPFTSVILFDRDGDVAGGLTEPLVCAGWCDYGVGAVASDVWFDWAYHHAKVPNRRDDGTLQSVDPQVAWPAKGMQNRRFNSLGVPLMQIRGVEDLRARIVEPLLAGIARSNVPSNGVLTNTNSQ
jgi:hypothetical protein